jgi:hypothetical protein
MASLNSLVAGVVSLGVALIGCADPEPVDGDEATVVDGKGDGVTSFGLELYKYGGILRARETPKLSGSTSSTSFACPTDERTTEGWRLGCTRGKEQLTLIYDPAAQVAAAIYVKSTSSPDRRSYYHCTGTSTGADKWPEDLTCESKSPRTNIGGQLVSPFNSSIPDIGIYNAHVVSDDAASGAQLLRGMKPFRDSDMEDLQNLGVDAVLIFKKATQASEVDVETDALAAIGIPASRVVNVPFAWKDFPDFAEPCRQTVHSLSVLHDWVKSGKTAFFHCTVGEDRTGYLAGLYRLLTETGTPREMFDGELCQRGYSAGNPQKPMFGVANEVDADLTPLFLKMAFKIRTGELSETSLDESVCDTDPETDAAFTGAEWDAEAYRCSPSTRYRL